MSLFSLQPLNRLVQFVWESSRCKILFCNSELLHLLQSNFRHRHSKVVLYWSTLCKFSWVDLFFIHYTFLLRYFYHPLTINIFGSNYSNLSLRVYYPGSPLSHIIIFTEIKGISWNIPGSVVFLVCDFAFWVFVMYIKTRIIIVAGIIVVGGGNV